MAAKAANFNAMIDKFYKSGLLKEVYSSDRAKVCNVFDQFYIAYSLDIMDGYTDQFPGFMMGTAGLKRIVEDDNFVNNYYQHLTPEQQDKVLILLDQGYFDHLSSDRSRLEQMAPNPKLDLDFERQVIAAQSKKGELASMLAEQQAQSLATAQQKGVPSQK